MKGGAETIQIFISNSQGTVDNSKPAVTLTFSDIKSLSKKQKLLMSVDLNKFKGDVRKLIDFLFEIKGFDSKTHSRTKFLVGLADEPAREGVTQWAKTYVNKYCNDKNPNINFHDINNDKVRTEMDRLIDETLLPTKTCDIEIELFENNGDITFTVQNYHRMKIRNIQKDCNHYDRIKKTYNDSIVDENGNPQETRIPHITRYEKENLFYPKLEFASAKPAIGGIDYFDYEAMNRKDGSKVIVYEKKDQTFTFTKANSTIESLKTSLKEKTIMLDTNGEFTTPKDEEQKKSDAEAAENARIESENQFSKILEERRKNEAERIKQLSVSSNTRFEGLKDDRKFVEDDEEFERLKKAISDTKEFMDLVNEHKTHESKAWTEMLEPLKTAVSTKYTEQQIPEIEESLKIFREKYWRTHGSDYGEGIRTKLDNYYTYTLGGKLLFELRDYLTILGSYDSEIDKLLSILTIPTSD